MTNRIRKIKVGDSERRVFFNPNCPITSHYYLADETERVHKHYQFGLDGELVFAHSENTRASYISGRRDHDRVKFVAEPEICIDGTLLAYAINFNEDNVQHLSTRVEAYTLAQALQSHLQTQGIEPIRRESEALERIVQYGKQHNLLG